MQKIVKFKSVNAADRVQQHLYRVTKDVDRLIFSNFGKDKEAFELAVALEGLTLADYSYVQDTSSIDSVRYTGFTPRRFRQATAFVGFTLEAPENQYSSFRLNVIHDAEVGVISSNGCYTLPLKLDDTLAYFLQKIQLLAHLTGEVRNTISTIASNLESAHLQFNRSPTVGDLSLVIYGAGSSQTIGLDVLTDFVYTVEREMYE